MEEFVRRFFADAEFRREFLANPASVVANSGLKGNERDAALRLSGTMAAAAAAPRPSILSLDGATWQ